VHLVVLSDYTRISPFRKAAGFVSQNRGGYVRTLKTNSAPSRQCYYSLMLRSGFVLSGGRSSRMGRDKALLQFQGATLISHVARAVEEAAGNVTLVGNPERYSFLGYPVVRDRVQGRGPLGGIYTALRVSSTAWNLVVACDMPGISAPVLTALLDGAGRSRARCVTASGCNGEAEPLCAVYHRDCLPVLAGALRDKRFRMKDLVKELDAEAQVVEPGTLANVNTPAEWKEFEEG